MPFKPSVVAQSVLPVFRRWRQNQRFKDIFSYIGSFRPARVLDTLKKLNADGMVREGILGGIANTKECLRSHMGIYYNRNFLNT